MPGVRSILIGLLSGSLLVLSLPKPDLYPLAWVALIPLLIWIIHARSMREVLAASYTAGVTFYAGTFYWITETMVIYGGVGTVAAFGIGLLFCLAYGFMLVLFAAPVRLAVQRWGPAGVLAAAPFWVAVELFRTYWISGFPWMLFGYALVPFSGILQIVTWTGVYGLSFIATAVNSGIAYGVATRHKGWLIASSAAAILLALMPIIPAPSPPSGNALDVRLVQTRIPLDHPWQEESTSRGLMDELSALSTVTPGTSRLIVWPETPAPFYLAEDASLRERIQRIAQSSNAYVLLGYIDKAGELPTNSAGMVDPQGRQVYRYDKMHLVPFGEYIPLKTLLFFADSLTRQVGDFQPGTDYTVGSIDEHRFATAICYESIFPDLVRQFVKRGAELLVVITNDGWFGESSAPFQHLRMGVVRAVENRRYEVRTANTGVSAIIDPYGRIRESTPIGRRTAVDGRVYFRTEQTFYTQYGDVFAYLSFVVAVVLLVLIRRRSRALPSQGRMNVRRSH